ncbi:hypothetical protein Lfu02_32500 [Longispora fulva]|uniref:Putative nucleotidyltransferase n=1 Tax=Longispora fulva TaxID=619741 RepID=A0A8J7GWX3_9ACTN|nr:hypothetical protein [Longispora fulva]MBG6139381.1 putative nucleotidyltransferase [Longispora fulva]GIG58878.1 hypothetical protein Lfu02_32500 [Longispora fulva]
MTTPADLLAYAHARLSALLDRADSDMNTEPRDLQYIVEDLLDELHALRVVIDPNRPNA